MHRRIFSIMMGLLAWSLAAHTQALPAYGIAVGNISIHADSTFSSKSTALLKAGEQAAIISGTRREHEDDAQKQLFRWWKIESNTGKKGWVFGDGFAVLEQKSNLPTGLQAHQLSQQHFGAGFENCRMWFGVISGRDLAAGSNFMGSNYVETYLVLSNDSGKSIYVPLSGESQFGKTIIDHLEVLEATGDQIPEILVQKTSQGIERKKASKWVDIYAFQAGTLRKVFGESLSQQEGNFRGNMHLAINQSLIQCSYLKEPATEGGVQLFVETWYWNPRIKEFEILYAAQPSMLSASPKSLSTALTETPAGHRLTTLTTSTQVFIRKYIAKAGRPIYAQVITDMGLKGFVRLDQLRLINYSEEAWLKNQLMSKRSDALLYSLTGRG